MDIASKTRRIEAVAYQLWEREGRPAGRHLAHWAKAERLVDEPASSVDGAAEDQKSGLQGDQDHSYWQDTPGRPKTASSRQQTQPDQAIQTGAESLDSGKPATSTRGNKRTRPKP